MLLMLIHENAIKFLYFELVQSARSGTISFNVLKIELNWTEEKKVIELDRKNKREKTTSYCRIIGERLILAI